MEQLDVTTAYLIPKLEETIYMHMPPGVRHEDGDVVRLKKCLYGLKQSGKKWNQHLHNTLISQGLQQSKYDPCLYLKFDETGQLTLILVAYVDDISIGGTKAAVATLSDQLTKAYKMTRGKMNHFLGMHVKRNDNGDITISQGAYIERVLKRFNHDQCAADSTPGTERLSKRDEPTEGSDEQNDMTKFPYRECVGALQFLSVLTRPEITFAVN